MEDITAIEESAVESREFGGKTHDVTIETNGITIETRDSNPAELYQTGLKHFREIKGISQKVLAELCGWGASRVGNYEAGVRSINLDDAETLAEHLGIAPYQILFDVNELSNTSAIKTTQPSFKASYPVISSVQAGMWKEAVEPYNIDEIDSFIETTERVSDCSFWLKVESLKVESLKGSSL